jgi:hypothetical protein
MIQANMIQYFKYILNILYLFYLNIYIRLNKNIKIVYTILYYIIL